MCTLDNNVVYFYQWDAVASRSERRTLSTENPSSNHFASVSKRWQFRSPHVAAIHSAVNEYLATDRSGYVNE